MNWHSIEQGSGADEWVWLHGWGQDHRAFMGLAQALLRYGQHRLYDLPGFGQTPMLQERAGSYDYATALHTILRDGFSSPPQDERAETDKAAHPEPVEGWTDKNLDCRVEPTDSPLNDIRNTKKRQIIVGHSYGARVAVQLAAHWPDRVDALVLIAGAGLPRTRSLNWKIKASLLKLLGQFARLMGPSAQSRYRARFGSADYKAAGPLRATLVSAVREDLSAEAKKVRCPVLLIYGEQDDATPPEIGEKFHALIPQSTLKILPRLGHLDILDRGVHTVAHQIEEFVTRLP